MSDREINQTVSPCVNKITIYIWNVLNQTTVYELLGLVVISLLILLLVVNQLYINKPN